MAIFEIRDRGNTVVGEVSVTDAVFDRPVKKSVLHEAIVNNMANQRAGTHATKTRGQVAGSGRKPWRQKGTGRARHGTRRSPLWRKGGVTFGPQPRDHSYRIPRRKMKLALCMVLSAKQRGGQITVLDELSIDAPKTREVAALLENLKLDRSTLIYDPEGSERLARATRNLPNAKVVAGYGLSVYDLLVHDDLLTSKAGIARIDEALR